VNRVLPFIKEATAKERAMMGNKSAWGNHTSLGPLSSQTLVMAGSKRKRDAVEGVDESAMKSYFFAKFLTSPDLLDLEVRRSSSRDCFRSLSTTTDRRYTLPATVHLPTPDNPPAPSHPHETCQASGFKSREQTSPYPRVHSRTNGRPMGPRNPPQMHRGAEANHTQWSFVR